MCVFLFVCDARWGRRLRALHFSSRTFFFNVYSKWEHSTQFWHQPLCYTEWHMETPAPCTMNVQNVYKCVYVGVNPALAPVSRFTPLSTTQGHEGPRAQGLSSGQRFPKPQSPLGECKGNRAGSVLMGFADVCCWRRSPKASSFVCLGCATNNVNWKKLTFWTFYSEVMCGLSAVDNLMFNVLFHLIV